MKLFGRLFFPKSPPHQQLKNARELATAMILGVLLASAIGLFMYFHNKNAH
jgi:hypothetical protein